MDKKDIKIWDLEKYKVEKPNRFKDFIDEDVYFDFKNRERAIRLLFDTTSDNDVKQVLRFAMELNNHYREEAVNLFYVFCDISSQLKLLLESIRKTKLDIYL